MTIMNWEKESQKQNPIYPEGTYKVKISKVERVTASTGTPQLRWYASILDPAEHVGRSMVVHTPLTEKALWKVASLIHGCSVNTAKLSNMDTSSELFDKVCKTCVGRNSFWRNVPSADNKGNPRNDIIQFLQDTNQDIIDFVDGGDVPDGEWKE